MISGSVGVSGRHVSMLLCQRINEKYGRYQSSTEITALLKKKMGIFIEIKQECYRRFIKSWCTLFHSTIKAIKWIPICIQSCGSKTGVISEISHIRFVWECSNPLDACNQRSQKTLIPFMTCLCSLLNCK